MKYSISLICQLTRWEADNYRSLYDEAVKDREAAIEKLNANYLPNTPLYQKKEAGIQQKFDDTISQLRAEATQHIQPDLDALRAQEISRTQKTPTGALMRLQTLSDIPITSTELKILLADIPEDDYWSRRLAAQIAERNGITAEEIALEPPIDVKMSIIDQLQTQMEKILEYYPDGDALNREEGKNTKYLYLNDDVLKHAQQIYNGASSTLSPSEAASKAYLTIRGQQSQTAKGICASNALRNASPQMRNYLLYDLSTDEDFSDTAAALSGCGDEIRDFKTAEFETALQAMESIKKSADKSEVGDILAKNRENGFLTDMYSTELKTNGLLSDLIAAPASDS